MRTMTFHRLFIAALVLIWILCGGSDGLSLAPGGGGALAQDDMGMDLTGDKKSKKKKKKKKKKKSGKDKRKAAPREDDDEGDEEDLSPLPAIGGGGASKAPPSRASSKPSGEGGMEALDVSVSSADKEAFEKALDMMKGEDFTKAAITFHQLGANQKQPSEQGENAEYQLAKALYRMRLYHSSLASFGKIMAKGMGHKYFRTSLEWLFFISHKITDQREVLKDIARYSEIEFPDKYKDEFAFLLAKYFYFRALELEQLDVSAAAAVAKRDDGKAGAAASGDDLSLDLAGGGGNKDEGGGYGLEIDSAKKAGPSALPTDVPGFLSRAKSLLMQVGEDSKFYAKAKYLEGVVLYKEANFQGSLESFKEVVRILNPRKNKLRDDRLREMAFFQLARIHYEHKQFSGALHYYSMVSRDSEIWLDSLFESAWANFRLGRYQKALGNLITLDSPFFRDEYYPEALVIKAVTYYENCRYPESNKIVDEFKRRYEPLHRELTALLARSQSPEGYYNQLLGIQKAPAGGSSGSMLRRVLKLALADEDLSRMNASVLEMDREIRKVQRLGTEFARSPLGMEMMDRLTQGKADLIRRAGIMTKHQLDEQANILGDLIGQMMRIKLENDQAELEVLRKVQAGEQDLGPAVLSYEWSAATDDEKEFWPYQGEYWRDELGTYEYTLTWGCRRPTR